MSGARLHAFLPVIAFAALAGVLTGVGSLPAVEGLAAVLSVVLGLLPSGWLAPAGWWRRAAEMALLPAAFALVLIDDPTMRRMAMPPLLLLVALAAAMAALPRVERRFQPWLVAGLALAVRAAGSLGLVGEPGWWVLLVAAAVGVSAAAAARLAGWRGGVAAALLVGSLPLEAAPAWAAAALVAVAGLTLLLPARRTGGRLARGWLPGVLAVSLAAAALAPWRVLAPAHALPGAGMPAGLLVATCLIATPMLPAAGAGAAWLAATMALGPIQPPPPDLPGFRLDANHPQAAPPRGDGRPYLIEAALADPAGLPDGAPVARVLLGGREVVLHAGEDVAFQQERRDDHASATVRRTPAIPVWRPAGEGRGASWGAAGRTVLTVPAGVAPLITREPGLPQGAVIEGATAGPSRATPPRDWPLPRWILAAAVVVAVLQVAARSWRGGAAALPWALLTAASLAARMPVEPLHLLAERHAVDIALVALLAAWLPAARAWLPRRRTFLTAAALLVPLALATPHLTQPVGDENYHLLLLTSLRQDGDFDLVNNLDLDHDPQNRIYVPFAHTLLHSPVLALLVFPGFALFGRAGALLMLALAGAALAALLRAAAERLGVSPVRAGVLTMVLLLGYPFATFATELWVELPGACLAALALIWITGLRPRPFLASLAAVLGVALKTRLGLVMVPLAVAAWWPRRWRWRELRTPVFASLATAAVSLALAWLLLGDPMDPLGRRTLGSLLPHSWRLAATAFGGLAFDSSGGLLFAAPLGLAALAGVVPLWRGGGRGERALLLGAAATLIPLLNIAEWRGGDAPPARYLVPLLPAAALAAAMLFRSPSRARPLGVLLLPPTLLFSWVCVTRPFLAVSSGDGGSWLADALARRFAADARHLFPSFLRPSPATWVVPLVVLAAGSGAVLAARRWPQSARALARCVVAGWLLAGAALVLGLALRHDRVVEFEDPQVAPHGGRLEPPRGSFARFTVANGWRVADGDGVEVPLNLAPAARLRLEGWAEGDARSRGIIVAAWGSGVPVSLPLAGWERQPLVLAAPAEGGRQRLRLSLLTPAGGEVVLDRLVVLDR